jgi:hypothetical protein
MTGTGPLSPVRRRTVALLTLLALSVPALVGAIGTSAAGSARADGTTPATASATSAPAPTTGTVRPDSQDWD